VEAEVAQVALPPQFLEDPVEVAAVVPLHLRATEQEYSPHMILHLVQNLHQEHPVDMVILAVPGIPQCQEQIQLEHRGRVAAALVKLEVVDLILQVATANHIK
jgi:hypothetical protein